MPARKETKMHKLILLDIDGTLRDEQKGIPCSARKAVLRAQQLGCKVVVCTGRSKGTITDDVLSLKIDGYISGGGCHIDFHNKLIYDAAFEDDLIQKILKLLSSEDVAFTLESKQRVFMNEKARKILDNMNMEKAKKVKNIQKQLIQEKIVYTDNIKEFQHEPIHKVCVWSSEGVLAKVQKILKDSMQIAQSEDDYYEIIQYDCHKGEAVRKLQEYLQLSKGETICFGDGQNDIEMFHASGVGVAMANSHPKLKNIADSICEDAWNHGIYNELKRRKII